MANGNGCGDTQNGGDGSVEPANPFTALNPHFGMLLGVEDLEVMQGYARGKMRLHNAWLHRAGVAWGLDVRFDARPDGTVLAVDPGLAVDGAGRELYLARTACVDIGQWFAKHQHDDGFSPVDAGDGAKRFSVEVVACFRACLDRPVPAVATPCEGSGADTAYSRLEETADLYLRPLPVEPPSPAPLPYPRLRVLFQIADDESGFPDVVAIRTGIQALAPADQPRAYLAAARQLAARDAIDLAPQEANGVRSLYPEDPGCVRLATITDVVVKPTADGGFTLVTPPPTPDVRVRPTLIATTTIQELLCGPVVAAMGGGSPPPPPPDAGGPRADPASVVMAAKRITFTTTSALAAASVDVAAFSVTAFDADDGWAVVDLRAASYDDGTKTVTLDLRETLPLGLVRLIIKGTGPEPILGADNVPFAGAKGGPPGGASDGCDFVFMTERS
jgi:hypothetical protein